MRAVSFVYRRMVAKPTEGGLKDFFEQNWKAFDVEGATFILILRAVCARCFLRQLQ